VNAEIGIDEEGRAYIQLTKLTQTEHNLMLFMRKFLPLRYSEIDGEARIIGDRLPGSGSGLKAQDATK
jgi:hypothetical protein